MKRHKIKLEGPEAKGARISTRTLAAVLAALEGTAKRSLRLRVEARSNLQGKAEWLDEATDFQLVGLSEGSTVLEFEVPSLQDAAPSVFHQLPLWDNRPHPDETAFGIVEDTLRQAQSGNTESDVLDRNVLEAVTDFRFVLERGFEAIVFNGTPSQPVRVTSDGLRTAERLRSEAPCPERVIVSGWLDQVTDSRRSFRLLLPEGQTVRGVFPPGDLAPFEALWRKKVVVDGEARFRPSGTISVIIASSVQAASLADAAWEHVPRPRVTDIAELRPRTAPTPGTNGLAQVFGEWPGDESTEELLHALKALDE